MWAARGLAVALVLSVLPGGRALRPGDCEGAGGAGWKLAEGGTPGPAPPARSGRAAGSGAFRVRGAPGVGVAVAQLPAAHWGRGECVSTVFSPSFNSKEWALCVGHRVVPVPRVPGRCPPPAPENGGRKTPSACPR